MKRPPLSAFPERPQNMPDSTTHDSPRSGRVKPIRVTVDLDPVDYDTLRVRLRGAYDSH